ncbi:hypothetical protein IscW_ISCW000121 [Ixodes scapularis]|uniref:Uncharacterized protein n=1 Tax=Ixodes scapularis TaxID=6945 RepID=B7P0T6_IXOSC|nr:hypothetical protein IscW_ISCW000121 [Ixodes scapularis]|eukprot:XP_002399362.1 hypothetical protein IscW_ISCW000121 [Ixodes scapularis]
MRCHTTPLVVALVTSFPFRITRGLGEALAYAGCVAAYGSIDRAHPRLPPADPRQSQELRGCVRSLFPPFFPSGC